MRVLALALLLTFSAATKEVEERGVPDITDRRADQIPSSGAESDDPCARARQIGAQRPCLAAGDCPALQLWDRSFGPPRFEPLDPERAGYRNLPPAGALRWRHRPGEPPRRWRSSPFAICPLASEPRR